ncbi:hypothetical protein CY35_05G038500 [Sphagnum magellanicum]|nr:hypothetical protein CY35_05G038500 [Sphagnum magellanicum]KAH9561733.1 hypothetical protein CY35_05G038500 [Sphagnum magellanicum]
MSAKKSEGFVTRTTLVASKSLQAVQHTALEAAQALGRGFDVTSDFRLGFVKGSAGSVLVKIDQENLRNLVPAAGIVIPNVSCDIKCVPGERTHYKSDILPFVEMSERFNQGAAIEGKMPLGLFNSMYGFNGPWQTDQQSTKALALDGWFIKLFSLQLTQYPLILHDQVRDAVPSLWDPKALASFIEKYGTHIIVGVVIGGKDVVYVRQHQSSPATVTEVQKLMQTVADNRFLGQAYRERTVREKDVDIICRRRGGDDMVDSHSIWLASVPAAPDVIAIRFVSIASLLRGVSGKNFLSHAINLYLQFKPPIEELQYFLEFQTPIQWSPTRSDLGLGPQRKEPVFPVIQFSLMGPKLYINTTQVSVGRRPVTGLRLCLEGKKCNRLAIHLQHLSTLPQIFQPHWDSHVSIGAPMWKSPEEQDIRWFEPVQWKAFGHVSTAPIEHSESWVGDSNDAFIVTGAQLQVWDFGMKNVLYMKLLYSRVPKCSIRRSVWDDMPATSQKSGLLSQLGLTGSTGNPQQVVLLLI